MEFAKKPMRSILFWTLMLGRVDSSSADCILSAKSKTSYVILDSHTLILKGGIGKDVLVKSYHFFNSASQITVLKDSFCDYESAVLYVDGEVVDAQQVKSL